MVTAEEAKLLREGWVRCERACAPWNEPGRPRYHPGPVLVEQALFNAAHEENIRANQRVLWQVFGGTAGPT